MELYKAGLRQPGSLGGERIALHSFAPVAALLPRPLVPAPGPTRPGSEKSPREEVGEQAPEPTSLSVALASPQLPWLPQLLQTTNNSPMNSKPQQIKMQSTKKGPLTKREDGGPPGGPVVGVPLPGDEACSLGASQSAASSSLQPAVSVPPGPVPGSRPPQVG